MKKDKKTIIEIRHYDDEFEQHTDEQLVYYGCISVIHTINELRIIEHENASKTTVRALTKYDAITIRNWGN